MIYYYFILNSKNNYKGVIFMLDELKANTKWKNNLVNKVINNSNKEKEYMEL